MSAPMKKKFIVSVLFGVIAGITITSSIFYIGKTALRAQADVLEAAYAEILPVLGKGFNNLDSKDFALLQGFHEQQLGHASVLLHASLLANGEYDEADRILIECSNFPLAESHLCYGRAEDMLSGTNTCPSTSEFCGGYAEYVSGRETFLKEIVAQKPSINEYTFVLSAIGKYLL